MEYICLGIIGIGGLVLLYGTVIFLIIAFRESFFWGVACLLVPVASLVFLIKYWEDTRTAFLIQLAGGVVCGAGLFWASFH